VSGGNPTTVYALTTLSDGKLVVAGQFTTAGGVPANNIAVYDPADGEWSALGSGISGGLDQTYVYTLTTLPDGDIIAGGRFTQAGGVAVNGIARWDGLAWSALGTGMDGYTSGNATIVYALTTLPNGDIVAGGNFTTAGGVNANNIARWDISDSTWAPIGAGVTSTDSSESYVTALTTLPNGGIVAGGFFSTAGSTPVNNIARWNGSGWSELGTGVVQTNLGVGAVLSLTTLSNGSIVAGGLFTNASGVAVNNVARWDGSSWSPLGIGVTAPYNGSYPWVAVLTTLPNGDLIAGGRFNTAGQVGVLNLARYSSAPTITTQPVSATVCSNSTATLTVVPSGTGPFTYQWRFWGEVINTTTNPSAATATLTLTNLSGADEGPYDCIVSSPCGSVTSNAADLTVISCGCQNNPSDVAGPGQSIGPDRQLTADDIIVFQNWYFAKVTHADIAGPSQSTTPDGQFTADDLIVFFNRYFAGC
jgi:hypothetical protein